MSSTISSRQLLKSYPLGQRPVMYQRWEDLLFLHWEVSPELIQSTLPLGLKVDTFNTKAYIGIVPFFMQAVRPAYLPAVPHLSYFQELNVRTYVTNQDGIPGVWFYSLDANRILAVQIARRLFSLNYFQASMQARRSSVINYSALRRDQSLSANYIYSPGEILDSPTPASLESFLLDRYLLYSYNTKQNKLFQGRVWHQPYRLRKVVLNSYSDAPMVWNGQQRFERSPDHICMSADVAVKIFKIQNVC